ncbi:MAG: hypothetical protein M0P73_01690 [Syntrophobacterales bacterium]|jgi:hypothetical protein|nr:hypothetical protein [Syntrophobacterales bacterium]
MSDHPEPRDLEAVLAKLETEWQELAALLKSQAQPQTRVIEAEKIVLRDAAGKSRGRISVNTDGSADLILTDGDGQAWARLGINQDGEASLQLHDRHGEVSYQVPAASALPGSETAIPASTPDELPAAPPPATEPDPVRVRLEKLERRYRRQRVFGGLMLGLVLVLLATQALLLDRFFWRQGPLEVESLEVRDRLGGLRARLGEQNGKVLLDLWDRQGQRRAGLGLGPEGSPDLTFYDRGQPRAELKLGPQGEPQFNLYSKLQNPGRTETNTTGDLANQEAQIGVTAGTEDDTLASVPANEAEVKEAAVEPEAVYVGSKTSNKYHYPACRWVKQIRPESLMKFKSVQDAREHRHYIPCPECRPPRAD